MTRIKLRDAITVSAVLISISGVGHATMLDDIKAKGYVKCGINSGFIGFSAPDASGNWAGFDVDFCKAVASAIFGAPNKVRYQPLTAIDRFPALQSDEVDLLSRNTTWTASRDSSLGFNFRAITYYDGQGFMVHKSLNVKSAFELSGTEVCVQAGTTTELNLADFFKSNKLDYRPIVFEKEEAFLRPMRRVVATCTQQTCPACTSGF
ncbi:general L-amino acid transport system substrate-binding protein [Rhizobium mongolense]|uniref:General L-amino acid transport system substrate-binding protein n=1 Tax=Rhizobium mongolense TaxID=57676 RepID=A0ABR6IIQ1_9HYPH|nr:general L-amino acid transport system substrate-binding protein [Rhizobium mongolense]